MELVYPLVMIIGLPLLIILVFLKFKENNDYENGAKVANTKYIKDMPYYKSIMKKIKTLKLIIKALCVLSILLSLILIARPAAIDETKLAIHRRDIFLCMDVSASVDELNKELINSLKETVNELKGERVGITIFNTSPVLLVPLTDDYSYIINVLDTISKSIDANNYSENYEFSDDYVYLARYIIGGTQEGAEERGSSLIGDGLASCVYNFVNLEEERTKTIIFSTDNDLAGTEIITLKEAANLCKSKDITVFGVAPNNIRVGNETKLKEAVELTGGSYYNQGSLKNVSSIVKEIEQKGKELIEESKDIRKIDIPKIPFIILNISLMLLFVLSKKVNL